MLGRELADAPNGPRFLHAVDEDIFFILNLGVTYGCTLAQTNKVPSRWRASCVIAQ